MASPDQSGLKSDRVRIVVATSVMLTFISYWRAAAIVLNDLASSAFYACGIAEQAIGKSAPWFIVGVMLFPLPYVRYTSKAARCLCGAASTES